MNPPTPVTSPEVLAAGYARCAQVTREFGTTYYWGARLLPAASRRHVHAVYTLARLADDIVDDAGPNPGPETARELDAFERSFWVALATGTSTDPVMAAIATSVRECGIEDECFTRFFGAMRSDLTRRTYETWGDLLGYMDGSAAVIGEMMLPVLRPGTDAVAPARALGL
ncbi:MAG: phytoene/squalene synthase family protein, partial [Ornithinibacter sp.]